MSSTSKAKKVEPARNGKDLKSLVDKICNSGQPSLDPAHIKAVKKTCKADEDAVLPELFSLLMVNLKRQHSEVRLSAFQVLTEIFERSHKFRLLVLDDLQEVLAFVLETDPMSRPLPPPKAAKQLLNSLAINKVDEWVKSFGKAYPKLHHAYNFLRHAKRVSFNQLDTERSEAEARKRAEKEERAKAVWKQRTTEVRREMSDMLSDGRDDDRSDFDDCILQIQNCLELLLPSPENFLHGEAKEGTAGHQETDGREHGILGVRNTVSVTVDPVAASVDTGDANNAVLVENLRDQYLLLTNRLLPTVKKWIVILTKAGNEDTHELLKVAIDLKIKLEQAEVKARALGDDILVKPKGIKADSDDSDDGDDDFEEVEEKVDYERSAEDDSLLEMVFLRSEQQDQPKPGPSKPREEKKPLFLAEENDPSDPTTFAASLKKMGRDHATPEKREKAAKTREDVPVLPFDVDLMDWGKEAKPRTVLRQTDAHRFWASSMAEDEVVVPGSTTRERSIDFSGSFEAVKWSCRAPLPSGKLCPRKDRKKCPLHGPVVPRDPVTGQPSSSEPASTSGDQDQEVSWNDPDLLRDIEGATGHDLGSSKKGKGKGKRSGLTNIEQEKQNTTRKRLEKKIFNRSSMKRVAESLDSADSKRIKNKFADQFNYMYNK